MQHGFIKVAAAVPRIHLADPAANADEAIRLIAQAEEKGVQVLAFPELSLTGYSCGDLFLQEPLLSAARQALCSVAEATLGREMLVLVGLPLAEGGAIYNVAAALCDGTVLGFVPKTNLVSHGPLTEARFFASCAAAPAAIRFDGTEVPFGCDLVFAHGACRDLVVGVEVCEDLFVPNPPHARLAKAGASLVCNLSASPQTAGKASLRRELLCAASRRIKGAYLYANLGPGESSQDWAYSGHSLICENGELLAEMQWETGLLVTEIDVQAAAHARRRAGGFAGEEMRCVYWGKQLRETALTRKISPAPFLPEGGEADFCREILRIQAAGLRRRMEHTGTRKLVIGVSGGLDSTLALLVAAKALDLSGRERTDLLCVTMPCFGTTARTRSNAEILSERLGAEFMTVDIRAAVEQHFADIGHDASVTDVTYENAQARERTQVLMDLANRFGGMVVGTGDMSELALGWATYNGDHMSMYGVNAGLPKTLVRRVVEVFAADCADDALRQSLLDVVATPVSPELLPPSQGEIAQKTEDLVGPYELHDFFLYYVLMCGFGPGKIFRLACRAFERQYDEKTILHWLDTFFRRFFAQQFKRSCLPDGPAVLDVSLSPRGGWVMPSDALRGAWMAEIDRLREVRE